MSFAPPSDPSWQQRGPQLAPPGWYQDHASQRWLWWDGWQWVVPPAPPATSDEPQWFPATPTLQLPAAIAGIVFVVILTVLSHVITLLPDTPAAIASLAVLALSTFGMPALAWYGSRRWGTGNFVDDLGFRFRWIDIPLGIAGAIGLTILLTVFNVIVHVIGVPNGSNLSDVSERGRDVAVFLTLLVTAGFIAPLTEELLFRGLIQRGLSSRFAPWTAVVLQGLVFGSAHFTPSQGWGNVSLCVSLGIMGMALGAGARLTGRLGTGVVTHALFNCLQLGLLWLSLK